MKNKQLLLASLALASLCAGTAGFADELVVTEVRSEALLVSDEAKLELAKKASSAEVEKAVEAVLADTRLDLDIRLIGPTSVTIAGEH